MMDCNGEINFSKNCGAVSNSKGRDGFIDRSKVRILLCDSDAKSAEEVCKLLLKCCYQVTSVRSARQVIDALNAEGSDIDIILAEVDLPMTKGFKMLKYIARDKDWRRIPVIMMSSQDEVSIVVKCLRLGAADYLVKPLRTNELLNLWTHMWRRRHMLGLAEKNILNYDFDLVASDPSDANTNSTTLFSDDTDDKSRRSTNPEMGMPIHQEDEIAAGTAAATAAVEHLYSGLVENQLDAPVVGVCRKEQLPSVPKKSELKIGESSAFFTYVKSSILGTSSQKVTQNDENSAQHSGKEEKLQKGGQQVISEAPMHENGDVWETYSQGDDFHSGISIPDSLSMERSCTPTMSREFSQGNCNGEIFPQGLAHSRNEHQLDNSGLSEQTPYPYYMSRIVNQVMMPSSAKMYHENVNQVMMPLSAQRYQENAHDQQNNVTASMLPHYSHLPQCPPHVSGMASFPYYPVSICLQQSQVPATHSWSSLGNSNSAEVKLNKVDRREAALIKFRQKRKERCFDKKIRYVNRKRLAERRPRVRGQFVRKVNGVNVDLNGDPAPADYEDDEDEERNALKDSSPEDDASGS
ncbi:two-component response regulator-like APRR1 isoform X1 [Tripterygium wilfordii]|uniref:Two-component response regulator-like APRR1 isoform X1 n=1 Tax=Tripterygium wilfordii TaxID=458696 RepID=A0A7J7CKU4_TRIWF|nr:two-component response regulator-like APRR1 [Tripterygium wilfordii]KAF5734680.1 two-component response regulator-like APRR1 isoform X1 [Tripterygium wilfordii]